MIEKILSSALRQIGRDLGKVASNQIFGDLHATPIRHVNRVVSTPQPLVGTQSSDQRRKTDFEKAMGFRMSYTPKTLMNKLAEAFVEFKNESDVLLSDGYITTDESVYFMDMLSQFTEKAADVAEIMEMNPRTKDDDAKYMAAIFTEVKKYARDLAETGAAICEGKAEDIRRKLSDIEPPKEKGFPWISVVIFASSIGVGLVYWNTWWIILIVIIGFISGVSMVMDPVEDPNKERLEKELRKELSMKQTFDEILKNESIL